MMEYATLGEIADQVALQIQDSSAGKRSQILGEITRRYGIRCREHRWKELLRVSEERFSTTAGQSYLYLPKEVEQLYLLFPQNGLPPLQAAQIEDIISNNSSSYRTSGLALSWGEAGEVGYRSDFYTAGEQLQLSHSGSGTIECVVRGNVGGAEGVAAGNETTEVVSVVQGGGTTTTNTFTDLGAVSCQNLADGDLVSVVGVTSATTYAQIAAGERVARYKRIRFMPPTATADAVTMVWKKRAAKLREENQSVEIPLGQALVDDVVATMLSFKREYAGAQLHYQRAERDIEAVRRSDETDSPTVLQAVPGMSLRRGFRHGNRNGY
jgi:hypothetical protein